MQQFIKTKLFSLMAEATKRDVSVTDREQSYVAFANAVFAGVKTPEKALPHNSLCYAKAELVFLRKKTGSGEKKSAGTVVYREGYMPH
jgi:hypothetical protein